MSRRARSLLLASLVALTAACEPVPAAYPAGDDPDAAAPGAEGDRYADADPSALTDFREPLEGHGAWVEHPTYGTVWVPSATEVGPDFAPYVSAGHWAYDDDGDYVWVSDYSWGWAPFHYGRWVWADGTGWVWVPGRVYAGAWVVWRVGPDGYDYVGWAPMPPLFLWRGGYVVAYAPGPAPFVFLPRAHLFATAVSTHVLAHERAAEVGARTHVFAPGGGSVHLMAHPVGPAPSSLGHERAQVPHTSLSDGGVTHARAFGHPSTAAPLGARAPAARSYGKPRAVGVPRGFSRGRRK